jgi:hypothetical protein
MPCASICSAPEEPDPKYLPYRRKGHSPAHHSTTFTSYGDVTLMSLALLSIITALVLVLQIITLVLIARTRKSITGLKTAPQPIPPAIDRDRPRGRDNDFRRHDRRPFHDQKQRPQPQPQHQQPSPAGTSPAAPADEGIEKSLRDINLRLKNAERDQESARRRMQENMPRDQQRNRDDRNRDDRDRNRPRGGRDRNDRFGNRDHRRGNWQDRQDQRRDRQDRPMPSTPQGLTTPTAAAAEPAGESLFEVKNPMVLEPTATVQAQEAPTVASNQDQSSADYGSEEGLQHGRKIIVKRRPLSTDESSDAPSQNSGDSASPAQAAQSSPEEETPVSGSDAANAEIKFGRR